MSATIDAGTLHRHTIVLLVITAHCNSIPLICQLPAWARGMFWTNDKSRDSEMALVPQAEGFDTYRAARSRTCVSFPTNPARSVIALAVARPVGCLL